MTRRPLLAIVLAGCLPDAPEAPTFQEDVLPILAANCVRCHGYPRLAGPPEMRLDGYITTQSPDGPIIGAAAVATGIAVRIQDTVLRMPPRFPLDDLQRDTILNWIGDVAPGVEPERGAPRPDNRPPAIQLERLGSAGTVISFRYDLHDPDGDLVVGELHAVVGAADTVLAALHSGRDQIDWDAGPPPVSANLYARVDDGGDTFQLDLGPITAVAP